MCEVPITTINNGTCVCLQYTYPINFTKSVGSNEAIYSKAYTGTEQILIEKAPIIGGTTR